MQDAAIVLMLVIAIGIGYVLGHRAARKSVSQLSSLDRNYFKGLNLLLNEQPDAAIDTFINALEVNSDTLETHLALGNLLRRQGEVDRAVRIHQNLLARPGLPRPQQHHAQYELARDYIKAGLLDRAERLFQELVEQSPALRETSLEHLIEIYQDEKEWEKAIHATDQLIGKRYAKTNHATRWRQMQAHFCCELADASLHHNDYLSARRHLKSSLNYDKNLARASLLWGELEQRVGNYPEALRLLKKIPQQDPEYIGEALPLFIECYEALDDYSGLRKCLNQFQELYPSSSVVLELTERIRSSEGDSAAADYIGEQLKARPSVRGINRLLDFYLEHSKEKTQESLQLLKTLVGQLLASKPTYRCNHCGFSGNRLHWLCPSCKSWNTVKAIRGVEGE